jgi:hypothetical protein
MMRRIVAQLAGGIFAGLFRSPPSVWCGAGERRPWAGRKGQGPTDKAVEEVMKK